MEPVAAEPDALSRRTALEAHAAETSACTRCRLAEGRTQVVYGVGDPDADLMFVGEAPGFHEDKQGYPFVGSAGKLLDRLLEGIGLTRRDVYIANVLKCRPPGNRDPQPDEIEACESHLFRQLELIQPKLVATLGNFATKLLSRQADRDHARPRASAGGARRRAQRHALSDLPSCRRALHACDAEDARGGLQPHPGAPRRLVRPGRAGGGAGDPVSRAGSRRSRRRRLRPTSSSASSREPITPGAR